MAHIENRLGQADQPSGLEELGTPPDLRAAQPDRPPAPRKQALDPHKIDSQPKHARKHGLGAAWETLAYWTQYALLSVYGAGQQSRQDDPIERLRRKYGRPPRKN